MKAIVRERFGVEALELRDIPMPEPAEGEVLLRVRASSVNPIEFYDVFAPPFVRVANRQFRRPSELRIGADVAGSIESVGQGVEGFAPGDDVFGTCGGGWAEYTVAKAARLAAKPSSISFEDAAALPIAALTALQAVRDHAKVEPGDKVLVNGGSGGVGTYAVQIAKAFGAEVTAVCSTRNVEQARSLGAVRVIDYTAEDFTSSRDRFDSMIDVAGSRSLVRCRRILKHGATMVVVGAKMSNSVLGPIKHIAASALQSPFGSQKAKFFVAKVTSDDLAHLASMMEQGSLRSVIDRRFDLVDAADALRYLALGHARGKVVISVGT